MRKIGITGGVGAGKSQVLHTLSEICNCIIYQADTIAHELEMPTGPCYEPLVELLSRDVLSDTGEIDKRLMAAQIFASDEIRLKVNAIVHPAVKQYVMDAMATAETAGYDFFFLEAALLIEDHYDLILDEMWYVQVSEEIRIKRLEDSRGYSREKSLAIIRSQRSDEEFCSYASQIIQNDGSLTELREQLMDLVQDTHK